MMRKSESNPVKDVIICLVGPSGSGKTTIAKMLEQEYNVIHSYTTRPPREPGERGHIFVGDETVAFLAPVNESPEFVALKGDDEFHDIIAYTFYDDHHYWATREQYQGKGISIYIVEPSGVDALRREVTDARVVAVYLQTPSLERELRMKQRGDRTLDIYKRLDNDSHTFAICPCDFVVNGDGTREQVCELVKKVIGRVNAWKACI